jgi:anti-anti-sigma regulatory factor
MTIQARGGAHPAAPADHVGGGLVALRDHSLAQDLLALRARVGECLVHRQGRVAVDVSALSRMSSVTVAALLWSRRTCAAGAVPFAVEGVGVAAAHRQVLQRCGLLDEPPEGAPRW